MTLSRIEALQIAQAPGIFFFPTPLVSSGYFVQKSSINLYFVFFLFYLFFEVNHLEGGFKSMFFNVTLMLCNFSFIYYVQLLYYVGRE